MDVTGSTAGLAARASDGVGIIVVDRARKIVFKNALAESFLASNGSLLEYRQTLTSRMPSVDMRLRAAVLNPGRKPGMSAAPHLMHLPRAPGMPLVALMVPLEASAEDLGALVLFWDPQATPMLPAAVLCQHFGLTTAEALTALATYAGQTPAAIASCPTYVWQAPWIRSRPCALARGSSHRRIVCMTR
jgi:hypothetical protein